MGVSALSGQPVDTWRPPVVLALPGSTFFPTILVGPIIEFFKSKNKNGKENGKKSKGEEGETSMECEPRVVLTPLKGYSRSGSVSSNRTDDLSISETPRTKRRKFNTKEKEELEVFGGGCLRAVSDERMELEKFLFDESHKISRPVIKHILDKWATMEARLQNTLVKNEILKERNKRVEVPSEKISYAQAAAMRMHEPRLQGAVDPKKKIAPPKEKYEVLIIKPEEEDNRNNEQIKEEVMKKLEGMRKKLKVRNIRQTRKQGVLIEVVDHKDMETINACDLKKDGFVVERPRKVNPFIILP